MQRESDLLDPVLVTGAGIVGTQIARQLIDQGRTVVLLDIAPEPRHIGSIADTQKLHLVKCDVTDAAMLVRVVQEHALQGVIHTAALLTNSAMRDPARAVAVNIDGAVNVMELARHGLVKRVVLGGSTTFQYPTFSAPGPETISENFPVEIVREAPKSVYSSTKLAMEFLAHNYIEQFGADIGVVRYAAVIGAWPGPNAGLVARLVGLLMDAAIQDKAAILDDPSYMWQGFEEFVDVRDCAAGSIAALDAPELRSRVYHLSNPVGYSFPQFIQTAQAIWPGLRVDLRTEARGGFAAFPWPRTRLSDIGLARRELGYAPSYELRQSLEYCASFTRLRYEEAVPMLPSSLRTEEPAQ